MPRHVGSPQVAEGVDLKRGPAFGEGGVNLPHGDVIVRQPVMRIGVVGIQFDGAIELPLGSPQSQS